MNTQSNIIKLRKENSKCNRCGERNTWAICAKCQKKVYGQ